MISRNQTQFSLYLLTACVRVCLLHECIKGIGHESVMIYSVPGAYVPHVDTRRIQSVEYGLCNGLILAANIVQVKEAHLRPVEGQQQCNH